MCKDIYRSFFFVVAKNWILTINWRKAEQIIVYKWNRMLLRKPKNILLKETLEDLCELLENEVSRIRII